MGNSNLGQFFHYHRATLIGLSALLMWALEPLLVSEINDLPIFELLTIIFFSSFSLTAIRITYKGIWQQVLNQPWYVWMVGVVGICGSDYGYIYATQYAPIAHVELIDYLWPSFAILFASLLPKEVIRFRYVFGALIGFAGIFYMFQAEVLAQSFKPSYLFGYAVALVGAAIWGGYCAFSRFKHHIPTEIIGVYCGLGAVISFVMHLNFEIFVVPTPQTGSLAVLTGITGAGLAYQLWDYGIKHGNIYLLGIWVYGARLMGMALLVLCGKEVLTVGLMIACGLGTLGVLISTADLSLFNPKRVLYRLWYSKRFGQLKEETGT